jgi:ABC-2 type transport system ATP-binding protein
VKVDGSTVEVEAASPTRALHELTSWALGKGVELDHLEVVRPSLEDVYLELTRED